jgi:glucose-1-phosphate adenylyltransferase
MVKQDRTFAYQFHGYWRDIGTTEAYFETSMELAHQQTTFSLNGTWPIITANKEMAQPKVSSEGNIVNSIISPGCIIKGRVEHSVISSGVWVGEDAIIKDSVLMANVFIGPDSRVESSIIDEVVSVGRSCLIGAINSQPIISGKITILEKGMVVPSFTNIGQDETDLLINEITEYISTPKETKTSYALAKY